MVSTMPGCMATELLERRALLTVPGPVTVTGAEIHPASDALATLTWDPVENADSYELWTTQIGHGKFDGREVPATSNQAIISVVYGDFHRFWVRAINSDGQGPWGPAFTQIVGSERPPEVQVIAESSDGPYESDTTPRFVWFHEFRARDYDVWVEKDGMSGPFLRFTQESQSDFDSRTWTPQDPLEDGVYRVWVRGRNANGAGPWSIPIIRAVGGEQPQVTGTTDSGVVLRPTINWTEGVQTVDYQLWVSRESDGQRVLLESGLSQNSFTPTEDLSAGIYRAWVRQVPQKGAPLPWSSMGRFEVGQNTIPATPVLTGSADPAGETFHDNVIFSWQSANNADKYELWISETTIGRVSLLETMDTSLSIDLSTLTFGNNSYRAWVRAIGSTGAKGEWSERVDFTVAHFVNGRHSVGL